MRSTWSFMFQDIRYALRVLLKNKGWTTMVVLSLANENPIGQRVGTSPETNSRFEIVGIVADAKYNSVRDSAPPTMYFAYLQRPVAATAFEVRTASDPEQMIPRIVKLSGRSTRIYR